MTAVRAIGSALVALALLPAPASGGSRLSPQAARAQTDADTFGVTVSGSLLSDYVYRGISLSARRPGVASAIELQYGMLYAGLEARSVSLPAQPAAELTFSGGLRKELAGIAFDLGVNYFYYPGETVTPTQPSDDYWQIGLSAKKQLFENFTLGGTATYTPNLSHTGAWGGYLQGTAAYDLSSYLFPQDSRFAFSVSGEVGRAFFGNTSFGYRLPDYLHWRLGLALSYEAITFDLSYHDTNLSRENCFVLTGDPSATPGGSIDLLSNPDGLRSRLCGSALVGTLSFEFDPLKRN